MLSWAQKVLARHKDKQTKTADSPSQFRSQASELEQHETQQIQDLKLALERNKLLPDITQMLMDIQHLPTHLPDVIERVATLMPANRILLYLVDKEGVRTERFLVGGPGQRLSEEVPFQELNEGLAGWVLRQGAPAISLKGSRDPRESETAYRTRQKRQIGSVIVAPLLYQGTTWGTLTALNLPDEPDFTEEDLLFLTTVADQLAMAWQNTTLLQMVQAREMRLLTTIHHAPLVLWVLDENGLVTFVEGQGLETLGLTAENVIGHAITELFAHVPQIIVDSQRTLAGETFVSTVLLDDRVWEIRHEPISGPRGEVTGTIEVAVDITERSQTEFGLRQRTLQLETLRQIGLELTAELGLNTLLESIVFRAVQLSGGDAGALYLYRADKDLLELAIRQGEGDMPISQRLEHGQGLPGRVWETGETWTMQAYQRWQGQPIDGDGEPYQAIIAVPIQLSTEFLGVLNVGIQQKNNAFEVDEELLTLFATQVAVAIHNARLHEQIQGYANQLEQHVAERTQELVEANERLQEMDRLKSKLIDDVSHELRTPVTSIGLYLDLLERGNEARQPYYIEVLHKQKERLVTLIEGIIKISRLRLMNSPTNFTAVDLNSVVHHLLETQQAHAIAAGLQLHFTPEDNLPPVKGDAQQLGDAIINIIANAILYTSTGQITIRTFAHEECICLEVQDTGIGIPAAEIPYIFERFYRGEQIGQLNKPGIGLGLTIAKETILFHGGDIEVKSEPDAGSTFRLCLPIMSDRL